MRLLTITLAVLTLIAPAEADDALERSPDLRVREADDAPEHSPELQVLARFIGTWDVQAFVQVAERKSTSKTVSTRYWSRGGAFMHFEAPYFSKFQQESHMVLTYNANTKNYVGVLMNGPSRLDITSTWDELTKTMQFKMQSMDGSVDNLTHTFVSEDRAEVSREFGKEELQIVDMKVKWIQTRQKTQAE